MEVWRDIVLAAAVLGMFLSGFYLMAKLDKFLDENRRAMDEDSENCVPTCVMLDGSLTDEEIIEEIQRFGSSHEEARVLLLDRSYEEMTEEIGYRILQKQ